MISPTLAVLNNQIISAGGRSAKALTPKQFEQLQPYWACSPALGAMFVFFAPTPERAQELVDGYNRYHSFTDADSRHTVKPYNGLFDHKNGLIPGLRQQYIVGPQNARSWYK